MKKLFIALAILTSLAGCSTLKRVGFVEPKTPMQKAFYALAVNAAVRQEAAASTRNGIMPKLLAAGVLGKTDISRRMTDSMIEPTAGPIAGVSVTDVVNQVTDTIRAAKVVIAANHRIKEVQAAGADITMTDIYGERSIDDAARDELLAAL
jgi:uncharacterized protein YceK